MARVRRIMVTRPEELDILAARYTADGYQVATVTPTLVTLIRPKPQINGCMALLLGLPYWIWRLSKRSHAIALELAAPVPELSPDGQYRWDGATWQPVYGLDPAPAQVRPVAPVSPDGQYRWEGGAWHRIRDHDAAGTRPMFAPYDDG